MCLWRQLAAEEDEVCGAITTVEASMDASDRICLGD